MALGSVMGSHYYAPMTGSYRKFFVTQVSHGNVYRLALLLSNQKSPFGTHASRRFTRIAARPTAISRRSRTTCNGQTP